MEQNNANEAPNTNGPTPDAQGNNSMLLIIGAVVLAAILGYAIFSSANTNDDSANEDAMNEENQQTTEDSTMQDEGEGTDGMMEEDSTDSMEIEGEMETDMNTPQGTMEAETNMETAATEESEVKEFTLEAGAYYYEPNVLNVNEGDTVRITINSVDMMHDFVLDEFNASTEVAQAGETATVEFVADEAGTYEFYCSVGNHREQGMVGTLNVQ